MRIEEHDFGSMSDGTAVRLIRTIAAGGLEAAFTSYGATLVSVRLPDNSGNTGELTLGFDSLDGYLGTHPYFGATVGRYANRISGGGFDLNGKRYELTRNSRGQHLHGGTIGFNRVLWETSVTADSDEANVEFRYVSVGGEEGYPGNLEVTLTYTVSDENLLRISYVATADSDTPINLTNHAYWNLTGPGNDVREHLVTINADSYLWVDEDLIPDGRILAVDATPFDFRRRKSIIEDFEAAGGYDHNFIVQGRPGEVRTAAVVESVESGRRMTVSTNQPTIQFYTTNMMKDMPGREGVTFGQYGALCLETGCYNDAVNRPEFPSSILKKGQTYRHITNHIFEIL